MHLKRDLLSRLKHWKERPDRLPLILWGARQVGKSTLVTHFGESEFPKVHVFNFQKSTSLHSIFQQDLDPRKILQALSLAVGQSIGPEDLVFFDEIQECAPALTSLKYFAEGLKHQAVVAAGSYLGLVKSEAAFPVGRVQFLSLHPLTFLEFLANLDPATHQEILHVGALSVQPIPGFYHQRALQWLRLYFCSGGLPEVVKVFAQHFPAGEVTAMVAARDVQTRLLEGYRGDFAKHAGTVNSNHILRVFDAVALQLARAQDESVERFRFGQVIPQKKGFDSIDGPLSWLEKARLVIKCYPASKWEHPLKAHTRPNMFKVYFFDVGLLHAQLDVPVAAVLQGELGSYKGYLAENFVAQELFARTDQPLLAWAEGESEVEFAIQREAELCPVEVKASAKSRRARSLDSLIQRYQPSVSIKLTLQNIGFEERRRIHTLPMYLAGQL